MVLRYFINVLLVFLTNLSIQCKPSQQCKCCQSCRCCNQNNTSSYYKEKHGVDDRDIYYYLQDNRNLTQQDINKIAENYLRIVNEADDTVKTLDEVTTDILTPKIIIQHLGINKAINEIDNINDVREKIIKINWIVNDDFINKKYTYENSNLKLPRCLVKHEDNNCVLESYFTAMLSDPYRIKLFYLLNYLFENGLLLEENYPVTFEVCKFFYEAVNHPNFTDTIRCISVMKAYFDNYQNCDYLRLHEDENGERPTYGSFQYFDFASEILGKIKDELNTGQGLQLTYNNSLLRYRGKHCGHKFSVQVDCHLCYDFTNIKGTNSLNYSAYNYNGNFIPFTAILFFAEKFHFYTFRKINNTWVSYDSYKVKTPTPVSEKFFSRLILNSILRIHNFNGAYSGYITCIQHHCDLFDNHPEGKLNNENINIDADEG